MAARVIVLSGPAQCGKTAALLAEYRAFLPQAEPGAALWLAPHQRSAAEVRRRLLDAELSGCFAPGIATFEQFADGLLRFAPLSIRPIGRAARRQLLHRLILRLSRHGKLPAFSPLAHSSGLLDVVEGSIAELKRREIWPEDWKRACGREGRTKDRDLLLVYQAYQELLQRHQWYDAEGRFWSARSLLAEGHTRSVERVRLVVVDGFSDFTRTQHEILDHLAGIAQRMIISLPLEEDSCRGDLFDKSQQNLAELRGRHPGLEHRTLPRRPLGWAAMQHLESQLFRLPAQQTPAADCTGILVRGASGQLSEIRWIARTIKQLLIEGDPASDNSPVAPTDVVVAFRTLADASHLVREVFDEFGLPYALETGLPLDRAPALGALLGLLRLVARDWEFSDLLSAIGNSHFQLAADTDSQLTAVAAAERLVRELQLPSGRDKLLARITALAKQPAPAPHDTSPAAQRRRLAQDALPLIERLAQVVEGMPRLATASQWADLLRQLANRSGLTDCLARLNASDDQRALDTLLAAMQEQERLDAELGDEAPSIELEEMLAWLADLVRNTQIPATHDETGRIRVLSAASLRGLRVPYLFLAGLAEHAMPRPEASHLLQEVDAARLRAAGVEITSTSDRSHEEMLLFYEMVTRATRRLYFSYPALDSKAQQLLPSPYLEEVRHALGPQLAWDESVDLSPIPAAGAAWCLADWRLQSLHEAIDHARTNSLRQFLRAEGNRPSGANLLAGVGVVRSRAALDFGAFDGLLSGESTLASLLHHFRADRAWSVSELQEFAVCPFRYFAGRVLRLEPLADLELGIDAPARGGLMHDVLAQFHRELNARLGGPTALSQVDAAELRRLWSQTAERAVKRAEGEGRLDRGMAAVLAAWFERLLDVYTQLHASYDEQQRALERPPRPLHFEFSFGMELSEGIDERSTTAPLSVEIEGETLNFRGRIDRVDVGSAGGVTIFNVIDYKSSRGTKQDIDTRMQLELYALAAEQLLWNGGAVAGLAEYLPLRPGPDARALRLKWNSLVDLEDRPRPTEEALARRQQTLARILQLVRGIRAGEFVVFNPDEDCGRYCDFRTICRVNQARAIGKTWPAQTPQN